MIRKTAMALSKADYEEYIDHKGGNFIVSKSRDFEGLLHKKELQVGGAVTRVGERTCLFGWFDEPLQYCGFYHEKWAVFYLGEDKTIFENKHYYDLTFVSSEERIGKSYKAGTFRDAFLREKNGEMYWK